MSNTALNYQQLLTDTLQSQMIILGPAITLTKAMNVPGLHVDDHGKVTAIDGNPQEVSIKLLEQFRELSPLMVKKTMKPLLDAIITAYPTSASHTDEQKTTEQPQHEEEKKEAQGSEEPNKDQPIQSTTVH